VRQNRIAVAKARDYPAAVGHVVERLDPRSITFVRAAT
jgi:hypothetical protein